MFPPLKNWATLLTQSIFISDASCGRIVFPIIAIAAGPVGLISACGSEFALDQPNTGWGWNDVVFERRKVWLPISVVPLEVGAVRPLPYLAPAFFLIDNPIKRAERGLIVADILPSVVVFQFGQDVLVARVEEADQAMDFVSGLTAETS